MSPVLFDPLSESLQREAPILGEPTLRGPDCLPRSFPSRIEASARNTRFPAIASRAKDHPSQARWAMEYAIKTVCVVGLGYIGLPTAATLASRGVEVIGVDINPRVVEAVNAGQPYFSEPDLDMLLRAATTLRKLRATLAAGAGRCVLDRGPDAVPRGPIAQSRLYRHGGGRDRAGSRLRQCRDPGIDLAGRHDRAAGDSSGRGCGRISASRRPGMRSRSTCMSRIARSGCCPAGWSGS